MKGFIENLNGIYVRYLILNTLLPLVFFGIMKIFESFNMPDKYNMYLSVLLMLCILFFVFKGRKQFNKNLSQTKGKTLGEKLNVYQKSSNMRFRSFSMISIIACLGMIASGRIEYLMFSALALLLIALCKTTILKLKYELNLTDEEVKRIENK